MFETGFSQCNVSDRSLGKFDLSTRQQLCLHQPFESPINRSDFKPQPKIRVDFSMPGFI
jgi:hypothetical protein